MAARPTELGLLWCLYFVQGLPFGFQASALPVILRESGASLTLVGLSGGLALPWLLKPLWAPLVDRHHSPRWGRRRSWLLPMQLALIATALATSVVGGALLPLLVCVLLANLFAATLDIAVDGLAVDTLSDADLGHGNAAQVVGYKLGMLTGGGVMLALSARVGLQGVFLLIALLTAMVMGFTWAFRERPGSGAATATPTRIRDVWLTLLRAIANRGGGWVLLAVATYKLGESMSDAMFKPFLVDSGFARETIGFWVGSVGIALSIVGSLAGAVLATKLGFVRALVVTGALRVLPIAALVWLAGHQPTLAEMAWITGAEHLFGGALTTAMFAFMMSRVDRSIGATHFTVLAAVEVLGKAPSGWLSGLLADAHGYRLVFVLATALSLGFLLTLLPLRRDVPPSRASGSRSE